MSQLRPADDSPPSGNAVDVDAALLRTWPLPQPGEGGKAARGDVLVVGGTVQTPGAVVLAGLAALRAGAGRLKIATAEPVAAHVALAVPEARVIALPADETGAIAAHSVEKALAPALGNMDAVLIGPGSLGPDETAPWLESILPAIDGATVVIDANAAVALAQRSRPLKAVEGRAILVPNPVEAASMLDVDPEVIDEAPGDAAVKLSMQFGAVVAVRSPETWITAGPAPLYRDRSGNPGLGTSGSGDVASGIITGLAARGADALQAAVWGVHVHGTAGERLARRIGPVGFLARELLDEIPGVLASLTP